MRWPGFSTASAEFSRTRRLRKDEYPGRCPLEQPAIISGIYRPEYPESTAVTHPDVGSGTTGRVFHAPAGCSGNRSDRLPLPNQGLKARPETAENLFLDPDEVFMRDRP